LLVPAQAIVAEFLKTFEEFPPRAKPASFSIDQALEKARQAGDKLAAAAGGASTVQATTTKTNGAGLKKKEKEVAAHN
jgi:arylsulfatase